VANKSHYVDQIHALFVQIASLFWRFVNKMSRMDDTDRQLLSLLRDNARASVASLAKVLRVSRGTVQNRLARLEADGTITGYTVRLKPQAEGHRIRAFMTVAVEGNRTAAVLTALRGDPAVSALHTTNGRWDMVAELQADSLEAFDSVLSRIRLLEGIANTETSLLLSTTKL
jgi:DNA-binding Lrp family transcriptional regulator